MAEKRSVDVDVLAETADAPAARVGARRAAPGAPAAGGEGSPFVGGGGDRTPHRRSLLMSPGTLRESLASSVAAYGVRGTPPRKKMSMFTEEERRAVQSKQARRKAKLGMLRESLERAGLTCRPRGMSRQRRL